jgi:hypothetical protein
MQMQEDYVSDDDPSEPSDVGDDLGSQVQTVKLSSAVSGKGKPNFHKLIEKRQDENFEDSYDKYEVFKETPIQPQ